MSAISQRDVLADSYRVPAEPSPHAVDLSQYSKNISKLELELIRYKDWKHTAKVVRNIGIVLTITGLATAALFFSAPVSVPLLAGLVTASIILFPCVASNSIHAFFELAPIATIFGIYGAGAAGVFGWKPIVNFVYAAKAAAIAGIACGAITGVGGLVFGVGILGKKYCNQKITDISTQLATQRQKLNALKEEGTEMHVFKSGVRI